MFFASYEKRILKKFLIEKNFKILICFCEQIKKFPFQTIFKILTKISYLFWLKKADFFFFFCCKQIKIMQDQHSDNWECFYQLVTYILKIFEREKTMEHKSKTWVLLRSPNFVTILPQENECSRIFLANLKKEHDSTHFLVSFFIFTNQEFIQALMTIFP